MRRMIEKLDDFKRKDGEDEFIKVEGKVSNSALKAVYVKCAIAHNTVTFVADVIVKAGNSLNPYTEFVRYPIPKFIMEHLGRNTTIATTISPIIEIGNRTSQGNATCFLINLNGNEDVYSLMLTTAIDNSKNDFDVEFRVEFTFIL